MVLLDQFPWHELDPDGELVLSVQDPYWRNVEDALRKLLFRWRHFPADLVVEPRIDLPKLAWHSGFGLSLDEDIAVTDKANDVVGHGYHRVLSTDGDIARIAFPTVHYDADGTERIRAQGEALFDGILPVHMTGFLTYFQLWDFLTMWLSPEGVLYDLADRPEFIHAIMERLTQANLALLDQLESLGVLEPAQTAVHCSHAYTDELPAPGFDPAKPRAKDCWTFGMAQIFGSVSPEMHKEFEADYVRRIFERFGKVYYGCCEPLHDRIELVRTLPNVRKISISPWCDVDIAAEKIGRDFVASRKPSPAYLAPDSPDWDSVEAEVRHTLAACRRTGTPVEFILKDISTVRYQPQRLVEWERRVMALVRSF